jgi:hypothetical protein
MPMPTRKTGASAKPPYGAPSEAMPVQFVPQLR